MQSCDVYTFILIDSVILVLPKMVQFETFENEILRWFLTGGLMGIGIQLTLVASNQILLFLKLSC